MLREIWNISETVHLIDKDVLLPRMASTKWKEMFFIIAFADQRGAEVSNRGSMSRSGAMKQLQKTKLGNELSLTRCLMISSRKGEHPWDDLVKEITRTIGEQIENASREEDPK